jgi:hypothetical protein
MMYNVCRSFSFSLAGIVLVSTFSGQEQNTSLRFLDAGSARAVFENQSQSSAALFFFLHYILHHALLLDDGMGGIFFAHKRNCDFDFDSDVVCAQKLLSGH